MTKCAEWAECAQCLERCEEIRGLIELGFRATEAYAITVFDGYESGCMMWHSPDGRLALCQARPLHLPQVWKGGVV